MKNKIILIFFAIFLVMGCADTISKKGKKGDFSFRKCTGCNSTN